MKRRRDPLAILAALPGLILALAGETSVQAAAAAWRDFAARPEEWYRGPEGRRTADNILTWQASLGGWPKNVNSASEPFAGDAAKIRDTFDNGATTAELRFLARAFRATKDARYQQALLKGIDHILESQYPTGGWPQFHPPGTNYHRRITFNDDTMVRLMEFLRAVATTPDYEFVDAPRRKAAQEAFQRGVECILKCQITVQGRLTAWCAQHDEVDYRPRPARSYELASLSGAESAGILQLLMSLEAPGPEVARAVKAGAAWFEAARLTGIRQTVVNGDKRMVRDAQAPALWARFYEIESNRPIFASRDGVKKYDVAKIESERRNGYAWYGNWGERVATNYAKWCEKWAHLK
jgi:pectate lyase